MSNIMIDMLSLSPYVRFVQTFHANEFNYYVPWRILYDNEITFVTEGEYVVETENEKYVVKANEVHVMKPFVKHRYYVEKGKEFNYYGVHFDWFYDKNNPDFDVKETYLSQCWDMVKAAKIDEDLMGRKAYDSKEFPSVKSLFIHRFAEMKELFAELLSVFEGDLPSKPIRLRGIFLQILSEICDEVYLKQKNEVHGSDMVENYMNFIIENYQNEIDLPKIVGEYGISPSHFRKLFKTVTNKAPHEFLMEYRIKQAKKLLLTYKYTVTEVAFMVGYDDYHYFSRLFTNKVGCAPKTFQDRNK